jgi:hypothetical protein
MRIPFTVLPISAFLVLADPVIVGHQGLPPLRLILRIKP